ncbi:28S ribosomal protein S31, mitochondrial [Phlebotomus papatasi]|uniref:Small ribosomal subunit protein mS31 n=1 Tax=Phlebotomus papatasi TaxID=29031 RepID=A0A1B0D3Q2_PHLPP|nr:28S ribosomal protein S31, mitochondrial [Phlebotomus papatasi]
MIFRQVFGKNLIRINHMRQTTGRFFSKDSSRDSSSSDSDDDTQRPQIKKQLSSNSRLNELLASMKTVDKTLGESLDVTPKSLKKRQEDRNAPSNKKIEDAQSLERVTKDVAEVFGGNTHQTESDLLKKLLDISNQATEAKVRAEGGENSSKLIDIIVGMKIERTKKSDTIPSKGGKIARREDATSRIDNMERSSRERVLKAKSFDQQKFDRVNLWSGQALNLFPNGLKESSDPLKVWNILQNRELQATFETAPRNYFEKMQRWTVEGKIWRFPIDNEQGLEEEAKVYFADHVFLEPHIEPWCPKTGPVRHFMELVCVGLSKNPYITVREKQEHIEWFRNYFENKKELLQEIIVQDVGPRPGTSESKANK